MDFVSVSIAKLKLGSDCRIDLFFFFLKVIFTGQFIAGNVLLSAYNDKEKPTCCFILTASVACSFFFGGGRADRLGI